MRQASQDIPLISTDVLEEWAQLVFDGVKSFNVAVVFEKIRDTR